MPRLALPTSVPSEPIDLRLVVTDLDGTLLDGDGQLPPGLWPLLGRLRRRGIVLAPASGRQLPALQRLFGADPEGLAFIAENGTYVVHNGEELSSSPLQPGFARSLVGTVRELAAAGHDLGLVWCAREAAYIERSDDQFVAEVRRYYAELVGVDDLLEVTLEAITCAGLDCGEAELGSAALLAERCAPHQVVLSSPHWLDVMSPGVNKGVALDFLQRALGIAPEQTVVFGDYLNDLEMLAGAPHSFAMANAHPEVLDTARYVAPTNREHGVLSVVERLLDQPRRAA